MIKTLDLSELLFEAVTEVLGTMAGMEVEAAGSLAWEPGEQMLLSSITFRGQLEGCLTICCHVTLARAIAAGLLGRGCDDGPDDAQAADAMGEVVNMVMGSIKSGLLKLGFALEVSIPSVVRGQDLQPGLVDGSKQARLDILINGAYQAQLHLLYRLSECPLS